VLVLERFEKAFGTTVYEGYGLSETSPTASANQPWFGRRSGTVGHPIWGVEVEVADETVEERIDLLPAGGLGEIVIRGHNRWGRATRSSSASCALGSAARGH
jgi:long-chain acyl-CoA synthetase